MISLILFYEYLHKLIQLNAVKMKDNDETLFYKKTRYYHLEIKKF